MKKAVILIICIITINTICYSQVDFSEDWASSGWEYSNENDSIIDVTNKIIYKNDLTNLLKSAYPNYSEEKGILPLYGLLGDEFNKIEFVFSEVKRSEENRSQYIIQGKTKIDTIINDIKGYITFENATAYISEFEDEPTKIALIGSYKLYENTSKKNSGTYMGKIKIILSTNNIYAENILFNMGMQYEDGAVKGFVGVRKNNENGLSKSCIWGFARFPHLYAKDFDIGDGEEIINIKYAQPWFEYTEQEWNALIKDENEELHYTNKDKGIHTSREEYIKPEEATWHKLNPLDLKNIAVEQLKLNPDKIEFIVQKELFNESNETVIVIAEIENDLAEYDESDFSLTSHILVVNSITGKIKNHFSENSKNNGWVSNALYINDIIVDTKTYQLSEKDMAFAVKVTFKSNSQPNPYGYTNLSLYVKEENTLKKIIDDLVVHEYSGEVNVNNCNGNIKTEKNELNIMESSTNGYYDIQLKNTISNSIFEINSEGDCDDSEKSHAEKISILKYNNTRYE